MTKAEIVNEIARRNEWRLDVFYKCIDKLKELGVEYYIDSWAEDYESAGAYDLEAYTKDYDYIFRMIEPYPTVHMVIKNRDGEEVERTCFE